MQLIQVLFRAISLNGLSPRRYSLFRLFMAFFILSICSTNIALGGDVAIKHAIVTEISGSKRIDQVTEDESFRVQVLAVNNGDSPINSYLIVRVLKGTRIVDEAENDYDLLPIKDIYNKRGRSVNSAVLTINTPGTYTIEATIRRGAKNSANSVLATHRQNIMCVAKATTSTKPPSNSSASTPVLTPARAHSARIGLLSHDAKITKMIGQANAEMGKSLVHIAGTQTDSGRIIRTVNPDKQGTTFIDVDLAVGLAEEDVKAWERGGHTVQQALISRTVLRDPTRDELAYVVILISFSQYFDNTYGWCALAFRPVKRVSRSWQKVSGNDRTDFWETLDPVQGASPSVKYPDDWKWNATVQERFEKNLKKALAK